MTLPHIDQHAVPTHASREAVWASLLRMLTKTLGRSETFARLVGCDPATSSHPFDGAVGQTLPGFRVVASQPGHHLTLEGKHRFSRYRLGFVIDDDQILAISDGEFPGVLGKLYRTAVIGTGGHSMITRRMLRQVASAAGYR